MKGINLQIQETEWTSNSINSKKFKAFIIKFLKPKDKVKILKAVIEKRLIQCRGTMIQMTVTFPSETSGARRKWKFFKNWKKCQPRIIYPVKISFRNEGEINKFSRRGKLRELVTHFSFVEKAHLVIQLTLTFLYSRKWVFPLASDFVFFHFQTGISHRRC